jgi:hypothetical protein
MTTQPAAHLCQARGGLIDELLAGKSSTRQPRLLDLLESSLHRLAPPLITGSPHSRLPNGAGLHIGRRS